MLHHRCESRRWGLQRGTGRKLTPVRLNELKLPDWVFILIPAKLSRSSRILPNLNKDRRWISHRWVLLGVTSVSTWRCCGRSDISPWAAAQSPAAGKPPGNCPSSSWLEARSETWPTWWTARLARPGPAGGRCTQDTVYIVTLQHRATEKPLFVLFSSLQSHVCRSFLY